MKKIEINSSDEINEEESRQFEKITREIKRQKIKDKIIKKFTPIFHKIKTIWQIISNAILWFCAVGGFVLSLLQFIQDK